MTVTNAPAIAAGPEPQPWVEAAIAEGGGRLVADPGEATALVWTSGDPVALGGLLEQHPAIHWVQLPAAGVERFVEAGVIDAKRRFTCAKAAYREPVAEHALLLALAGLRLLPERVRATSWGIPAGTSLYEQKVTILGGGGIGEALLELLAPFRVDATVVRRSGGALRGARRTVLVDRLPEALAGSLVAFVAVPLTATTRGLIGEAALSAMGPEAFLVNVARGAVVDTDALVAALTANRIAGAALDVTDPEPLPDGHPLWSLPNCIITPHTADTAEMIRPLLASRIAENVRRFGAGDPLIGLVDPLAGY